jgi:hypothetical protein
MCWLHQSAELWHYPTFLLWPLLLVACIECFAGYHAWRFLLGLNGALLGFMCGAMVCMMLDASLLVLLGAFVGAGAGAVFFAGIVPLGSAVFAFGSVASFTILAGRAVGLPSACYLAIAAVAGIVVATAALKLGRPVMIAVAAVAGAQQIVAAWSAYRLPADSIPLPDTWIPSEWELLLALAFVGLLIQSATSRHLPPRTEKTVGYGADRLEKGETAPTRART